MKKTFVSEMVNVAMKNGEKFNGYWYDLGTSAVLMTMDEIAALDWMCGKDDNITHLDEVLEFAAKEQYTEKENYALDKMTKRIKNFDAEAVQMIQTVTVLGIYLKRNGIKVTTTRPTNYVDIAGLNTNDAVELIKNVYEQNVR